MADGPTNVRVAPGGETLAQRCLDAGGAAFCLVWLVTLLAFPALKGVPLGYAPVLGGAVLGLMLAWRPVRLAVASALAWPTDRRFLVALLLVSAALRLAAVWAFPLQPAQDDRQFHVYATEMLEGRGYGISGYRAFFPPGMSLALTAWYWVTTPSPLAGKLLQVLFGTLLVWLVYDLARQALREGEARVAGALAAVLPTLVFYTATLGHETLLAVLLTAAARLSITVARPAGRWWFAAVGIGLLSGYGALVKPICLLMPIVLGAAWAVLRVPWSRLVSAAAIVAVALTAVVAPWTYRNYRVLGAVVPVSTNGGTTLYSANSPWTRGVASPVVPLEGEAGEVSRDRLRMRAAVAWMAANPGRVVELAAIKATYVWGTSSSIMSVVSADRLPVAAEAALMGVINVCWTALAVLVAVATWKARPWSNPALVPAVAILGYVFALHLLWEAISRHHIPVLAPILVIAASVFAETPARTALSPARPPI